MKLWHDENFRKYFFYLYTKSTAVITPVLYLLLSNTLKLEVPEILKIAALYSALSIVIEIPTGILSDLVGARKTSLSAMFLLALSFLSLLFFSGIFGFHVFMFLSVLSSSLFSGSDQSLLRSLLSKDLYEEYREWSFKSNGMMYLYTTPLLILGVYLYQKNPAAVIIVQIILVCLGFVSVYRIPEKNTAKEYVALKMRVKSLVNGILLVLSQWRFVGTTIISGAFTSIVLVNHKTIQDQLSSMSYVSPLYSLAIAYGIGNVISWKSSNYFQNLTTKKIRSKVSILGLAVMGAIALYLLTLPLLMSAIFGFFMMCAFKSAYRPIVSAEFIKMCPHANNTATLFSAVAFFSSLINSGIHLIVSKSFSRGTEGNTILLVVYLGLIFLGLLLIYLKRSCCIKDIGKTQLNNKHNSICLVEDDIRFTQRYSSENFHVIHKTLLNLGAKLPYPSPKLIEINTKNFSVEWEFIKGANLESLSAEQLKPQIKSLLSSWKPSVCTEISLDFKPSDKLSSLYSEKYMGLIHSDLNPTNLISSEGKLVAVDWDLVQPGYFWYDALSLVTHPSLPLQLKDRAEIIKTLVDELSISEVESLIKDFCNYKVTQLQPWKQELKPTIDGFTLLAEELSVMNRRDA